MAISCLLPGTAHSNPVERSSSRVKKEQRSFTDEEMKKLIANAPEPLGTILAVTAVLRLRIGETLALRVSDLDFTQHVIRIRQSINAATRIVGGVNPSASSADLPMPSQLEARLRTHLQKHEGSELLFVNRRGRPYSANTLREKQLHPLLVKLGIPRGGFHSMRHGACCSLLADGATPAVAQSDEKWAAWEKGDHEEYAIFCFSAKSQDQPRQRRARRARCEAASNGRSSVSSMLLSVTNSF